MDHNLRGNCSSGISKCYQFSTRVRLINNLLEIDVLFCVETGFICWLYKEHWCEKPSPSASN